MSKRPASSASLFLPGRAVVDQIRRRASYSYIRFTMMHEVEAVEQYVQKATNVMAELDWKQRNTDEFPFGPMAETKRLAIIMTQKEQCADWRLIEALETQLSRDARSIILEHESRDHAESWFAFHNHAHTMFELLNEQCMPLEMLEFYSLV